jgi:DNA modification methylase
MDIHLIQANAGALPLPDNSVHACITSPPYYALRRYAAQDVDYGDWTGQLGLEPTPELYLKHMVEIFREVKRVLRADGVAWVNMGDGYSGFNGYNPNAPSNQGKKSLQSRRNAASDVNTRGNAASNLPAKNLMLIPQRLALALQTDGWWVRSFFAWLKANPMPESVGDRPSTAHEYIIMLTKSARYFYDADAVRVGHKKESLARYEYGLHLKQDDNATPAQKQRYYAGVGSSEKMGDFINPAGRNRRTTDAWNESIDFAIFQRRHEIAQLEALRDSDLPLDSHDLPAALQVNPKPYPGAHYATFPPALVEPFIKASTSERGVCSVCGAQWERVTEREFNQSGTFRKNTTGQEFYNGWESVPRGNTQVSTLGFRPTCEHADAPAIPATVLDIFGGTGVTAMVANALVRRGVAVEISGEYLDLAKTRTDLEVWQAWRAGDGLATEKTPDWEGTLFEELGS